MMNDSSMNSAINPKTRNPESRKSESSSTNLTSPSLLQRVRDHSPEAWGDLVDLYSPLIASWCRRRGLKDADTADVMQNVFISISRGLAGFRHQDRRAGTFRSWLWMITRNRIIDWYRSEGKSPAIGGSSNLRRCLEQEASPIGSDIDLEDVEPTSQLDLDRLLRRALQQIETRIAPQTWQAFWRCVIEGQATDVVAAELGLSALSVRQARSRVLRRLREQLGDR